MSLDEKIPKKQDKAISEISTSEGKFAIKSRRKTKLHPSPLRIKLSLAYFIRRSYSLSETAGEIFIFEFIFLLYLKEFSRSVSLINILV